MTENIKSNARARQRLAPASGVAFLWDESFLWGLMAYKALRSCGLPFDLIKADDIKAGILNKYKMLFIPGGWASNKIKALGDEGVAAVLRFVSGGGSYLGFCGGAGLATAGRDGIGLVNIKRRPTKERVPSFSGRIELHIGEHPILKDIHSHPPPTKGGRRGGGNSSPVFHAWWPSQFVVEDRNVKILARYGSALPDAFSSDICVGDVSPESKWDELEAIYKINLNPARLRDEPAVVEGTYGRGRVILSLVHFDTPDDISGQQVLVNLWEYLADSCPEREYKIVDGPVDLIRQSGISFGAHSEEDGSIRSGPYALCPELIALGERNFLWFWRNPMLLQWRRGVRGLEYNTLYVMMKEIQDAISRQPSGLSKDTDVHLKKSNELLVPFTEKARELLILERHALQNGPITYERCDDPEIRRLRAELFSESKSHGGEFKKLVDELDKVLFSLLTCRN